MTVNLAATSCLFKKALFLSFYWRSPYTENHIYGWGTLYNTGATGPAPEYLVVTLGTLDLGPTRPALRLRTALARCTNLART